MIAPVCAPCCRRIVLCLVAISGTISTSAWSQTHRVFTLQGSGLIGESQVRSTELSHQNLGLVMFRFGFAEGDHHVRKLHLMPTNDFLEVGYFDHRMDDPFSFAATYARLPLNGSQRRRYASGSCRDQCSVSIDRPANDGDQFVLQGFSVMDSSGIPNQPVGDVDHNIERIAVLPDPARGTVQVVMRDSTPSDPIAVAIFYSYLARADVENVGTVSGSKPKDSRRYRIAASGELKVIQGFDLRFTNGDHRLKNVGIDSRRDGFYVLYNDANLDDPASVTIHYVVVRGSPMSTAPTVQVRPASEGPNVKRR